MNLMYLHAGSIETVLARDGLPERGTNLVTLEQASATRSRYVQWIAAIRGSLHRWKQRRWKVTYTLASLDVQNLTHIACVLDSMLADEVWKLCYQLLREIAVKETRLMWWQAENNNKGTRGEGVLGGGEMRLIIDIPESINYCWVV